LIGEEVNSKRRIQKTERRRKVRGEEAFVPGWFISIEGCRKRFHNSRDLLIGRRAYLEGLEVSPGGKGILY